MGRQSELGSPTLNVCLLPAECQGWESRVTGGPQLGSPGVHAHAVLSWLISTSGQSSALPHGALRSFLLAVREDLSAVQLGASTRCPELCV